MGKLCHLYDCAGEKIGIVEVNIKVGVLSIASSENANGLDNFWCVV